jgi:tryptophan-rich sensory protein
LATLLLLTVLTAAAGAIFEAGDWYYIDMTRPSWTPPTWLFAAAWAVAYLFAALAAWNAWLTEHFDRLKAMTWWLVLMVLNVAWSFLFFGIHRPGWAWLAAGLAVVLTLYCLIVFKRLSGQAAGLLLPYLLWMLFIWAFNLAAWTLNGGPLSRLLN